MQRVQPAAGHCEEETKLTERQLATILQQGQGGRRDHDHDHDREVKFMGSGETTFEGSEGKILRNKDGVLVSWEPGYCTRRSKMPVGLLVRSRLDSRRSGGNQCSSTDVISLDDSSLLLGPVGLRQFPVGGPGDPMILNDHLSKWFRCLEVLQEVL
ncbi:hypothetical protein B0O80DRAFT_484460 [Mortierella sp. GBAus27b]|nr:hypothetical protein B0O80DRAFT_484460 [Mortierella sp. GBAus27b]